jgi:hypothetical protein
MELFMKATEFNLGNYSKIRNELVVRLEKEKIQWNQLRTYSGYFLIKNTDEAKKDNGIVNY